MSEDLSSISAESPPAAPDPVDSRLSSGVRRPLGWAERLEVLVAYHWVLFRRTFQSAIVSRFLLPVLFLASMGLGVGSLVDESSGGVGGVPYLTYIVPGLVMVTAMNVAVGESTWPVMGFIKWNEFYRAMLHTPHRVLDVLLAHWVMIAFNVLISAGAFMIVAALFGGVATWWSLLALPVAILLGMAFATPLFVVGAKAANDAIYSAVFRLVITPLMLFSGAFFPIENLPVWMQPVAWVTPLWHGVELGRAAFLGGPLPDLWAVHVGVLLAYTLVGAFFAVRAIRDRLVS